MMASIATIAGINVQQSLRSCGNHFLAIVAITDRNHMEAIVAIIWKPALTLSCGLYAWMKFKSG